MRLFFIACLCLVFVGCKSNKNDINEQEKVSTEEKFDSVIIKNIEKIQTSKNNYIDSLERTKIFSKISTWEIHGTEPFWNISLINNKMLFTKLNENIDTVYFRIDDFLIVENNILFKLQDINNKKAYLNLERKSNSVSDGMSDNLYNFSALFKYNDVELKGVAEKIK